MRRLQLMGWAALAVLLAAVPSFAQRFERATGSLTANSTCTTLDVGGLGTGTVELTGTWVGTVTFYVEGRNGTQNTVDSAKADTPATAVNSSTANGIWTVPVAGYQRMAACTTAYTSGTITVSLLAAGTGGGSSGGGGGGGGEVTSGTAANFLATVTGTSVEDAPETAGGGVFLAACVRRDTPASSSGTTGDNSTLNCDATGYLYTLDANSATIVTNTDRTADNIDTLLLNLASDAVHDNASEAAGPQLLLDAFDFDGAAAPGAVSAEGDAVRARATLSGIAYAMVVNEDGSKTAFLNEDDAEASGMLVAPIGFVRRDTAATSAGTAGDLATGNVDGLGRLWVRDGDPCSDPARITHAVISESTLATNEIVALNGSDLIYVCSYKWVTTAANSLNWTRGTGTDCATGTTAIEGAQPYDANSGVAEVGGGHALFVVPAGNALCLVSSAATAHGGRVSYVRTAAP